MKSITLLLMCSSVVLCHADPDEAAAKFLSIESASQKLRPSRDEKFSKTELPKEVVSVLAEDDWGRCEGQLPESFSGSSMDLKSDGKKEYFIANI